MTIKPWSSVDDIAQHPDSLGGHRLATVRVRELVVVLANIRRTSTWTRCPLDDCQSRPALRAGIWDAFHKRSSELAVDRYAEEGHA